MLQLFFTIILLRSTNTPHATSKQLKISSRHFTFNQPEMINFLFCDGLMALTTQLGYLSLSSLKPHTLQS